MKTQNPWMGRFRGSAGNMTGCKVYDKNVLRAKAFEVSNPNTPAQQNQRNFFKEMSELTAMFSEEELRTLFPNKPKSMSRRNALSKQLAEDNTVVDDQKVVDYAKINTLGNASTMDFGDTRCVFDEGVISVTLDPSVTQNQIYADNDFIAAIVNETKGEIHLSTQCTAVSDISVDITYPSHWQTSDQIHAIPLITNSKDGKIALVGFGTMGVIKRPAKGGL